ncbi:DUF4190 domain-containing protein [Streptomyces sp. ISL-66]|uniref:DUF4190 domain-containing protein n=1 Tax=Streptomyces sp. ISL-66 TaxID=2819186 RepID=UPI001BE809C8|nr:DUF4190 domain-containing protein [Streptomyces sp. ISL-66]MBT2469239.1 DUF4190 domain-containing protein [Streptomyces sp. ISL-66]
MTNPPQPPPHWPAPPPTPPPYGHPYGPPAFNGFALASLLVGLLCFPPLGVVFAIVALVQIAKKGERGRVLAVCGLVVSLVMTAVVVFAVDRAADTLFDRARALGALEPYEDVEGELTDIDELRAGDCFNVPGGDLLDEDPFVYRIACARVHDAEITSSTTLSGPRFQGAEEIKRSANEDCWRAQDAYAMDTWALPPYAEMFYFAPSRESWGDGDRRVVCVIGTAEQDHTGSLRKDAAMLKPEQVTFLHAMNEADQALGASPEEALEDALAEYRAWARRVDEALGAESRMLDGAKGRPELAGPAGVQKERVEAARREWRKAARASSTEEFSASWERALGELPVAAEKALRGAYGLSTTVPEWLEEAERDGPSVETVRL